MNEITDRNVFILGAGFSADAGAPVIRNFLDVSRELFDDPDSGLDPEERKLFQEVFDFKKKVAQAREKFEIDLNNIEELFGLVEMSHRLHPEDSGTRDATVYLIAKTLELAIAKQQRRPWMRFAISQDYRLSNPRWVESVPRQQSGNDVFECDTYRHFALLLAGSYDDPKKAKFRSNAVITFNYDLVLDDALRKAGIPPAYGLKEEANEKGVPVLKLHGSVNWLVCTDCRKPSVLQEGATTLFPFRSIQCKHCGKANLRLLLVPPSWDKSEYQDIMKPVWARAVKELQTATRICIIGYSMPESDSFFKYLLTLGLAENHQLYKLIVVDRVTGGFVLGGGPAEQDEHITRERIEQRYRGMLARLIAEKRFYFRDEGFALFLSRGANMLLSRAETIAPQ